MQYVKSYAKQLQDKYYNSLYADQNVFLDGVTFYTNIHDDVDVFLSPKFYWVRKLSLPFNSVSKALKIVEDFFSDILPEGEYKYKIIKKDDEFLMFAYQESVILDTLKKSGIDISFVNKIFFIQTEIDNMEIINIGHDELLYNKDGVLVKLPASIFDENTESVYLGDIIQDIQKTKSYITIDSNNGFVDSNVLKKIIFILSILVVFYFIEYLLIRSEVSKIVSSKNIATSKYNMPSSNIAFNSLMKTLEKKKQDSIQSRTDLHYLLSLSLKSDDYLKEVTVKTHKEKTFLIQIFLSDTKNASYYTELVSGKLSVSSAKVDGSIMSIRGKFE